MITALILWSFCWTTVCNFLIEARFQNPPLDTSSLTARYVFRANVVSRLTGMAAATTCMNSNVPADGAVTLSKTIGRNERSRAAPAMIKKAWIGRLVSWPAIAASAAPATLAMTTGPSVSGSSGGTTMMSNRPVAITSTKALATSKRPLPAGRSVTDVHCRFAPTLHGCVVVSMACVLGACCRLFLIFPSNLGPAEVS